jgi:hypothetical protein
LTICSVFGYIDPSLLPLLNFHEWPPCTTNVKLIIIREVVALLWGEDDVWLQDQGIGIIF